MIALVEGAKRQKTPNEIALDILLAAMTIIFLIACATLLPFSTYSVDAAGQGNADHGYGAGRAAGLPDSDDDRRPALGDRHRRHGSHDPGQRDRHVGPGRGSRRRCRRAAARQDRHDHARQPPGRGVHSGTGVDLPGLADAAQLASLADETPEGRSIVVLAKEKYGLRGRNVHELHATFIPFSAQTRISGVESGRPADPQGRGGRHRGVRRRHGGVQLPRQVQRAVEDIAKKGGTPLVVAEGSQAARRRFISRTSSRAASRSASPSCGGWASRR